MLECIRAVCCSNDRNGGYGVDETETYYLDATLIVNSDIVGNEFTGRDVSVSLSLEHGGLKISDPTVCTIRWAAAFLCSFGHECEAKESEELPRKLEFCLYRSTVIVEDDKFQLCSVYSEHLALREFGLDKAAERGAFGGRIDENLMSGEEQIKTYKVEFDNIVSSFPANSVEAVQN